MTNLDRQVCFSDRPKKQRHHFADKGPYSQICSFSSSHVWMWELDHKEGWALKNWCFWTVVLEKTLERPLDCKEIKLVNPKGNQSWIFIGRTDAGAETSNTLATSCEELTHWKRPWCWERLKAGGDGDDRGWDGWGASPTEWTWVWVNSGKWWRTGRLGVLQSRGLQRAGLDWVTKQQQQTSSLGKCSFRSFQFSQSEDFFCCWLVGVLYIFWILNPYQIYNLQIFYPILYVIFSLSWQCPSRHRNFKIWSSVYLSLSFLVFLLL